MGFFPPDRVPRVAQIGFVINADGGHNACRGLQSVNRVKPAAQTDFQNHNVRTGFLKDTQNRQGCKFKICERQTVARALHFFKRLNEQPVLDLFSINAGSFIEAKHMRRGVHSGFVARRAIDGFKHRAGAALAVCSSNSDHRAIKSNL